MLLLQIKCLEEGSLAYSIYQEAELNNWPGLGKDVRQICQEIGIPDLNHHIMRKEDIRKAVQHSHYEHMMHLFEGSSKLQDIKEDNFETMQLYFNDKNLDSARTKFKIRTKMLEKIPGNFKNRYKNQENGLKCDLCPAEMTQNHCLICPERQELRKNLNMENLDDLVIYFRQILSERST